MESIFKVKDPRKKFPFISSHIEIGYSKNFGRFIYCTKDISAGEVLLVEEPFFYSLDITNDTSNKRCAFCLDICSSEALTCSECNSSYCNQKCLEKSFHESECCLNRKASSDDGYFLLMIRVLIKSINICGGNFSQLKKFFECRNKELTFLNATDDDFGKLCCCLNLEQGNFEQDIKFAKAFVENENLEKFYSNQDEKFFLVKMILKILGILNRNSFCLELSDNSVGAIFPFASLINHSCSPNIERISIGGKKTAFICVRPIYKNEQLFICYRLIYFIARGHLKIKSEIE